MNINFRLRSVVLVSLQKTANFQPREKESRRAHAIFVSQIGVGPPFRLGGYGSTSVNGLAGPTLLLYYLTRLFGTAGDKTSVIMNESSYNYPRSLSCRDIRGSVIYGVPVEKYEELCKQLLACKDEINQLKMKVFMLKVELTAKQ